MKRMILNFKLAIEQVGLNRVRSLLTALGIVFGVGAVIAMLAIGAGARQAILDQMKLIGTNNILVKARIIKKNSDENEANGDSSKKPFSKGLSLQDVIAIQRILPEVESISPEMEIETNAIRAGKMDKVRCVGIDNSFFELNKLELAQGNRFHQEHLVNGKPVCIIGKNVQSRFFGDQNPIGQQIKCGNTWLTVIGVLQKRASGANRAKDLGIRDNNSNVYIPVKTAMLRFENRTRFAEKRLGRRNNQSGNNYHQLDRIVIRINDSAKLQASADVAARVLKRRHQGLMDFEIIIPELLLEQEQKTQDTFNYVLAAIAAISLLVGGIGIMNIMLASVLERIKEIGIRRSMGATEKDIVQQFLFEAVFISLIGGLLGVGLGYLAAGIIARSADIPTIVSWWSVLLSFAVASMVGLVFGLFPARKAARQDPITALRTD